MTEADTAPTPEPKITHYERRNNVMLAVMDIGPAQTHHVCASINAAKRLSRQLQASGKKVVVDKQSQNFNKAVRRHKVITKGQSVKKTLRAGPTMDANDAATLARHLIRRAAK